MVDFNILLREIIETKCTILTKLLSQFTFEHTRYDSIV